MPGKRNKLNQFFSELKRREVYKVAIAYGITAWLIAQISGLVSTSFDFPSWVIQMIITILIVGFPIAMILSWVFEVSSKGIIKTAPLASDGSDEHKPMETRLVIGILVLISLLMVGGWWTWQKFGFDKSPPIRSLVVLPFDNYTGSDEYEYFVAGMHSSLIQDIGKIGKLKVKSKTTANSYKETNLSVPEIAAELGIDAAVEGSITCLGKDSVCVQVRLISAYPEEKQLWVQDYRIEIGQILNFYNNVTKTISKEINIVLTPQEESLLAEARTVDPEAYDAYLMGQFYWEKLDEESMKKALEYFQIAIDKDPEWADPYAGLANAWGLFGTFFRVLPKSITLPKVYKYLDKALELDPNSAKAHYVKALNAVWANFDWEQGEKEFLRSLELNPNDALCHMYYAHLLMILSRLDEAEIQANIALQLDPLKPVVLGLYGVVMRNKDDYQSAIIHFEKALSIDPNFGFAKGNLLNVQMDASYINGDYKKWFELWGEKVKEPWNEEGRAAVLNVFYEKGHIAAIEEMFKMNDQYGNDCWMSGGIKAERYLKLGKYDKYLDYLEMKYKIRDMDSAYFATNLYHYNQLKDNPRYIALLKMMNLTIN